MTPSRFLSTAMPLTVGLISLGCPKNLVDSEIMIGHLQKAGMTMTPEPELADVMVVNTCAFIDQAKQEAIDAILDIVRARENGASLERSLNQNSWVEPAS